jgi:hypothetical protein
MQRERTRIEQEEDISGMINMTGYYFEPCQEKTGRIRTQIQKNVLGFWEENRP